MPACASLLGQYFLRPTCLHPNLKPSAAGSSWKGRTPLNPRLLPLAAIGAIYGSYGVKYFNIFYRVPPHPNLKPSAAGSSWKGRTPLNPRLLPPAAIGAIQGSSDVVESGGLEPSTFRV